MARSAEQAEAGDVKTYRFPNATINTDGNDEKKALKILADRDKLIRAGLHLSAVVFGMLALMSSISYLLSCLHTDRKDRSILFWKSLPFSESQSVASKLFIAAIIIPVMAFLFSIVVQLSIGIGVTYLYVGQQESLIGLGSYFAIFFDVFVTHMLIIPLVAIKLLPLFGWLIFCSAWSKSFPMVLSLLTPFCLYIFERLIIGTNYIGNFFSNIASYSRDGSFDALQSGDWTVIATDMLNYSVEQVIVGIVVAIVFILGAIWLRNNKYEI